jgi:hypothetical protein
MLERTTSSIEVSVAEVRIADPADRARIAGLVA